MIKLLKKIKFVNTRYPVLGFNRIVLEFAGYQASPCKLGPSNTDSANLLLIVNTQAESGNK